MVFRLCWPWWGALGGSTQVLHLLLHVFHLSCCLLRVFFFLFPLSLVCLKLGLVLLLQISCSGCISLCLCRRLSPDVVLFGEILELRLLVLFGGPSDDVGLLLKL